MKFEYQQDSLVLKVLDTSHTGEVLDFYKRNKDSFEKYETDKPSNFYTYTFIYNLLKAEYNACIHGKHIRFFLYDNSVSDKIIGSVSFTDIKSSMKSCVIGYKIDEKYRRMGYGRRMLTMALKIMVTEYGVTTSALLIYRNYLIKTPDTSIQNMDLKNHFCDSF